MSNNAKVLMVHQGVELYGSDRSFLSSLKAVSSSNAEVDVVLPGEGELNPYVDELADNVLVRPSGYLRRIDIVRNPISTILKILLEVFFFIKLIRKYDAVYINTVVCISSILACAFFSRNKKVVVHVREIPTGALMLLFRGMLWISRVSIIYNSESTKEHFSLPGDVVLNGVPAVKGEGEPLQNKTVGLVRLLMIGRINSWKGQDFLLESLANIEKDVEVRIVGGVFSDQYFYLENLKEIVKKRDLKVDFYGFSDDPAEHYNWADYVVVPSKLPEPFGRVAVEAFSSSTPVIAAAHGGLVEIISSGKDGFLFQANDFKSLSQVVKALPAKNSPEYELLSRGALEKYTNKFSEEAYMSSLLDVLKL
ncbi:MAG: glycosyltransferase family 4 protein [Colwellia sp.]|jgi:Glycosyltransferase